MSAGFSPCDHCKGLGEYDILVCGIDAEGRRTRRVRTQLCPLCRGLGSLTEEQRARRAAGQRQRAERLSRNVSLAAEAKAKQMTAAELSRLEFGRER